MRGFSFIELLIATALVALCGTGMITLQAHLGKMDEERVMRTHAWYLAQAKLDDLSQFQWLSSAGNPADDFISIATNTGGTLPSGPFSHPLSSTVSIGFQRNWQAQDRYFVDTTGDGITDTWVKASQLSPGHSAHQLPVQAKQVIVTISWTNRDGLLRQVEAEGLVAPLLAARAAAALTPYNTPIPVPLSGNALPGN
ncbi:type IV pilus modification PilV family protein [Alteromonas sp. AMM-1]|uniref:type IV pilus modification PilV family protein n=1 Tax=Alteromonas sp. AMM-1 TaxID=3394233 RepID=UPI0039A4202E